MKNIIRMLLTAVISLFIVSAFPVSVFAYEYGEPNLDEMIQVKKVGEKEITAISANDVNRIRISKSKTYRDKTDEEKLEEIFVALQMDLTEPQLEEALKMVDLTDIGAIRTSTIYLEVDEYGNQNQISKEEALSLSSVDNSVQVLSSETGPTASHSMAKPQDSKDGYMRQTFSAIYTPHYSGTNSTIGRYVILGVCQWLKDPVWTMTDAISLGGEDFQWRKFHTNISNYNLLLTYDMVQYYSNGESIVTSEADTYDEDDANIDSYKGVYFSFNLPTFGVNTESSVTFYNFSFLISAIARVRDYDDPGQELGIRMRYSHTYFSLTTNISFDWLSDDPLVISTTASVVSKYYDCSDGWDYAEHYYA